MSQDPMFYQRRAPGSSRPPNSKRRYSPRRTSTLRSSLREHDKYNSGISPWTLETIVAFGDSYTGGGKSDGSPLSPAVVVPPSILAGGRSTNGLTWIEGIANDFSATLKDYAQSGACTDLSLWPSNPKKVDFLGQMETFLGQSNNLDPETTLYAIFFGINDYLACLIDGDHMQAAAQVILDQIKILSSPPTNARLFLVTDVYGRGTSSGPGEAYKQAVFNGLNELHELPTNLKVSYVDFSAIWSGVLGSNPGYIAFGYTSTDACNAMCDDPEHYFYWIPGHPSKETMRIIADFVEEVWWFCRAPKER